MECKKEEYSISVTGVENLNEATKTDKRATSEQSCPSSSSKVTRHEDLDFSAPANEDRHKRHEEELQTYEVHEQAKFIVSLTNMLPKFNATIPPCYVGARDKGKLDNWLVKVEHYLDSIQVKTDRLKISIATTLFDGFAANWWYDRTKHITEGRELPILTWGQFVHIMEKTFSPAEARFTTQDHITVLKKASIPSYVTNFLSPQLENSSKSEKVSKFIGGLKSAPPFYLSSRNSTSMLEAIKLADKWAYTCAEEGEILPCKRRKTMTRQSSPARADRQPPYALHSRVDGINHPNRPNGFKRLTEAEMAEYRKRGLCFNCGGHGHTFFQCSQRCPQAY